MKFKLMLLLAKLGFFFYEGILAMAPQWWPRARVFYADSPVGIRPYSFDMPIGNALQHALATKGEVVPCEERIKPPRDPRWQLYVKAQKKNGRIEVEMYIGIGWILVWAIAMLAGYIIAVLALGLK